MGRRLTDAERVSRSEIKRFESVLDLIPDEVVLYIASADYQGYDGMRCLVGWVLRAHLAQVAQTSPEDEVSYGATGDNETDAGAAARIYGGDPEIWDAIYYGVQEEGFEEIEFEDGSYVTIAGDSGIQNPLVEIAWTNRVMKAVNRA